MKKKIWIVIGSVVAVIGLVLLIYSIVGASKPKKTDPEGAVKLYLERGDWGYRYPLQVAEAEYEKYAEKYNGNPPSGFMLRLSDAVKARKPDIKSYKVLKVDSDSPAKSGESKRLSDALWNTYGLSVLRVAVVQVELVYNNGMKETKDVVLFNAHEYGNINYWYVFEISDVGKHSLNIQEYRSVFSTL